MTVWIILAVLALLALVIFRPKSSGVDVSEIELQKQQPHHYHHETWEKNHFITQHQHRNDEAISRHKRNQTPW